nr:hypothetical protein Itr_chr15CG01890 [Ipomoea trifida]
MDNARIEGTHSNFLIPFHIRKQIQFKRERYMLVNLLDKRAIIFESLQMKDSATLRSQGDVDKLFESTKHTEAFITSCNSRLTTKRYNVHEALQHRIKKASSDRWGSRPPYNLGSVCPNSLPKLHPDQDEYLEELRTAGSESEPKSSITSLKSPSPFPIPVDSGGESVKPDMLPGNPSPVCGESGELRGED